MSENYLVQLDKEELCFSAAHFITYNGNVCEPLHGHNYRVTAEIEGALDENQYVVDFIALRDTLRSILGQLDHHMLLPTNHPLIQVAPSEREVEVRFEERRWVFPKGDCILLDVPNTTAEMLARTIGNELIEKLELGTKVEFRRITVGVDENHGQWGVWSHAV